MKRIAIAAAGLIALTGCTVTNTTGEDPSASQDASDRMAVIALQSGWDSMTPGQHESMCSAVDIDPVGMFGAFDAEYDTTAGVPIEYDVFVRFFDSACEGI